MSSRDRAAKGRVRAYSRSIRVSRLKAYEAISPAFAQTTCESPSLGCLSCPHCLRDDCASNIL